MGALTVVHQYEKIEFMSSVESSNLMGSTLWWSESACIYIYYSYVKVCIHGNKHCPLQGRSLDGNPCSSPQTSKTATGIQYIFKQHIRFLNHGPCYDMWGYHVIWCDTVCQHLIKAHDYTPEISIETRTLPNLSPEKDLPDFPTQQIDQVPS